MITQVKEFFTSMVGNILELLAQILGRSLSSDPEPAQEVIASDSEKYVYYDEELDYLITSRFPPEPTVDAMLGLIYIGEL